MSKLGIVSDEQFEQELTNCNTKPTVSAIVHPSVERGRGKNNVEVPSSLRNLIADEHLIHGRESAVELAKEFGVSESSVSAYAKGATSTSSYDKPDTTLSNYLAARKSRITKKALRVVTSSLDNITPEKLKDLSANKLAVIAKDVSSVVKSMEPDKDSGQSNNQPKFVIYAPTVRDERTYETIVVNDNY